MSLRLPPTSTLLQSGFALAAVALVAVYAALGEAQPPATWQAIDIASEGGTALMAAAWMCIVVGSRPAGRVTLLLALGLAGMALGAWADCLDEVFSMQAAPWRIDKAFESGLMPLGMGLLTWGLVGWRREQFQLSEHMQQRERLFRDHRAFDRITQLAHADYLGEQLAQERAQRPNEPCALLMLEIEGMAALLRTHGRRDAVRALRAVTHQLLLNLRCDDLLCRHAGDRFVVLLPGTALLEAERMATHLARMVGLTAFHAQDGQRCALGLRWASAPAGGGAEAATPRELLRRLSEALEAAADRPAAALAA